MIYNDLAPPPVTFRIGLLINQRKPNMLCLQTREMSSQHACQLNARCASVRVKRSVVL